MGRKTAEKNRKIKRHEIESNKKILIKYNLYLYYIFSARKREKKKRKQPEKTRTIK